MLRHLRERDRTVKAADVAKLDEKQQRRRGILEAGHYRLRCEFDQRAKLDDAEQRLESAREKDNRKRDRKHQRSAASADRRLVRMCEAEDQKAEEEGAGNSRSIDCRRLVAERHTGDGDHNCARYPRQCAVCKVIFAQRGECKHAVAHRQWNGDGGRHQAAENVIGGQRQFHRDGVRAGLPDEPRTGAHRSGFLDCREARTSWQDAMATRAAAARPDFRQMAVDQTANLSHS